MMPTYRVTDPSTGKTVKLTGDSPPTEMELNEIFGTLNSAPKQAISPIEPEPLPDEMNPMSYETTPRPGMVAQDARQAASGAYGALQNVGRVYPALETGAQIATSMYGLPAAGLAGLAALPFGLNKASNVVDTVAKSLIYSPQTQRGRELSEAANYPVEKLNELGGMAGGALEEAGYPNMGALAHSLIQAGPLPFTATRMVGKAVKPSPDWKISGIVKDAFNESVKPKVSGKSSAGLTENYYQKATNAVKTIIEEGEGKLPESLEEASQAVSTTLKKLHEYSSGMAQTAGAKGALVDVGKVRSFLDDIVKRKNTPESVKSAAMDGLKEISSYDDMISPIVSEDLLAHLNAKSKAFWKDQNPYAHESAFTFEKMAQLLRESTDSAVSKYEGPGWQDYRRKYGALKTIEKEMTDASTVWARKNVKGFFDLSDIHSAGAFVTGLMAQSPAAMAAGAAMWGTKRYIKWKNNRDRIIKDMFQKVDSIMKQGNP